MFTEVEYAIEEAEFLGEMQGLAQAIVSAPDGFSVVPARDAKTRPLEVIHPPARVEE